MQYLSFKLKHMNIYLVNNFHILGAKCGIEVVLPVMVELLICKVHICDFLEEMESSLEDMEVCK